MSIVANAASPGNANLPIGGWTDRANQEIGVPRFRLPET